LPHKSLLTKSITKEFGKLPKSVKEKLLDALKKAADSPYTGTELRGKTGGSMEIARGELKV
jgi:mRNA-degrading endonuclease RelE of RelBE toxin-antitoxin system